MSINLREATQAAREAVEALTYALKSYVAPGTVVTVRKARAFSSSCYFENFKVTGPHRVVAERDDSGQWVSGTEFEIELLPGSSIKRSGTNNDGRSLYGRNGRGPAEIICDPANEAVLRTALARAQRFLTAIHALWVSRRVRHLRTELTRANGEIVEAHERLSIYRSATTLIRMGNLIADATHALQRAEARRNAALRELVTLGRA
jgi:hypothetical protein